MRRDLGAVPTLVEGEDEVKFFGDNFSTKVCYEAMAGTMEDCSFSKFLWKKTVPPKVSFLLWAVFNNSLPTRDVLRHIRVDVESEVCVMCGLENETTYHLFIHCSKTFEVWDYFIKAFRISWTVPGTVLKLFNAWDWNVLTGKCKELWNLLHYALIWVVWDERNNRVFGGRHKFVYDIILHVMQTLILWCCEQATFSSINNTQVLQN